MCQKERERARARARPRARHGKHGEGLVLDKRRPMTPTRPNSLLYRVQPPRRLREGLEPGV